jgi:hypothetical protein
MLLRMSGLLGEVKGEIRLNRVTLHALFVLNMMFSCEKEEEGDEDRNTDSQMYSLISNYALSF